MEITNEIIAKVIAQYLGSICQTITRQTQGQGLSSKYLKGIFKEIDLGMSNSFIGVLLENETDFSNHTNYETKQCKLILKPISSLTNDHAFEVSKLIGGASHLSKESQISQVRSLFSSPNIYTSVTNISGIGWLKAFQYLQDNGYDLPQNLLNGQTLQEAGLAIYETPDLLK